MEDTNYGESPLVSVVCAYYNRENHVIDSINSLLNQTYKNLEIIVIDDGSTDETYQVLSSLKDPRLKVISQPNQGFVRAIRHAISVSNGEFVAIHGSGDISLLERIEKQVTLLQHKKDVGVVGCYLEYANEMENLSTIIKNNCEGNITKILKEKNIFSHGEVMFRRSIYNKVGGYRVFFKYAQDRDLWLRMSLYVNFSIVEEVLYKKYRLPNSVSSSLEKLVLQKYLSEFSVQCIDKRIKNGFDLIDKYGEYAFLFREKRKKIALIFWSVSIRCIYINKIEEAIWMNELSISEKYLIRNLITRIILLILKRFPSSQKQVKNLINLFSLVIKKKNNTFCYTQ